MKTKKYLLPLMLILIIFSACNNKDLLKEIPRDFFSPDNVYTEIVGIEEGIIGIYNDVREKWYSNAEGSGVGSMESYGLFSIGTDIGYDGETPGGQRFLNDYVTSVTPQSSTIENWFRSLYAEIQMANNIIEGVNNMDENKWKNDAQKMSYLAEARFFRAFAYRIAVTLWGDIPLVTEVISSAKTDFVRTPKADVYKQIEEDLIFATENLPIPGSEALGRLTQGAAWQLLTEVYLAQSKFQLAVDASSKVINNYNYALMTERFGEQFDVFGSGDVYWDLFRYNAQNPPLNSEAIWVIQFEPNVVGGSLNIWSLTYNPRPSMFGNAPDGKAAYKPQYQDTLGVGVARSRGTNLVFYGVWKDNWYNDIRNAEHNIKRKFYYSNPESIYDGKLIDLSEFPPGTRNLLKDTTNYIYPFVMKVWQPVVQAQRYHTYEDRGGAGRTHSDVYAMRLAETFLLRAEAYLGLGNKNMAAADINVVRNRANAIPVLPEDVDIDYILDERIRELYAEEMRMITLLRMGKLIERTRKYNDNPLMPGANIQDYNNLWPIPQTQIDLNRDVKLQQNPGY